MALRAKLLLLLVAFIDLSLTFSNKSWTEEQLLKAVPENRFGLTAEERDLVKYLNLCRLYPRDFVKYELDNYYGNKQAGYDLKNSTYRKSLIATLNHASPVKALRLDSFLVSDARCFSNELGQSGRKGHERFECGKRTSAECISYAKETGKEIALQLLVDHQVASLGHRKICLDSSYTFIGCSISDHIKFDKCAVVELKR